MKKLTFLLPLLTCVALMLSSRGVVAQFGSPNRSFHNATGFRLEGKHQTLACEACHQNNEYGATPKTCYDCHWLRRKDDRYQTRLGTQCEQCHRPTAWADVRWNHTAQSGLALNADHRALACDSCHRGQQFKTATVSCVGCHQKDFASTTAPNHVAAGFPTDCLACHKPGDSTWRTSGSGTFNHAAYFPLQGQHALQACSSCHRNNVYKGTSRDCVGCHLAQYNATKSPNHASAGFPTACEGCHRAADPSWAGAGTFNHANVFPLVGLHATQTCATCHKNNVYAGTPRECVGCHQTDYSNTRSPNHAAAGYSTTCESCHRPSDPAWTGGSFNHAGVFPLVGLHATQPCTACHKNNVYKGTPRDCVGCHLADYNGAQNPNHIAAGFPTVCDSCHRASDPSFRGAGFNHNAVYPLVGLHATAPCASCHGGGVYKGTTHACVGCHQADYSATNAPAHAQSGIGTTCSDCHRNSDTSWHQATYNHTSFPLVSQHKVSCTQCHTSPNYKTFTCFTCHSKSSTDSAHRGRAGYVYDSNACYSCHPNGR